MKTSRPLRSSNAGVASPLSAWLRRSVGLVCLAMLAACGGGGGGNNGDADAGTDADTTTADVGEDAQTDAETDTGTDTGTDSGCSPGTEDCACDDGACETGLICEADICVPDTSCMPGDTGCACTDSGGCLDANDECVEGVCAPRTSCDGELGCPCDMGVCDEGLSCIDDTCSVPGALSVDVAGIGLRACDIRLDVPGRTTAEVAFPAATRGRYRTLRSATALAIIRTEDRDLTGTVATLVFDEAVDDPSTVVVSASCYDRAGTLVADAAATVR